MSNQKYDLAELRDKCSPDKVHCSIGVRQLAFVFAQYDAEKARADSLYNKLQIASLKAKQDELAILKEKERAARAKLELERAEAEVGKLRSLVTALENLQQSTTNAICDANVTESCRQGILNAPKRISDMVAYNYARFGGSWPALSNDSPIPCPICGGSGHIGDCEED